MSSYTVSPDHIFASVSPQQHTYTMCLGFKSGFPEDN
jgi:hypothetical protein